MEALSDKCSVTYIKYIGCQENFKQEGVEYVFLRSSKIRYRLPFHMNRAVKKTHPDIVIVSGLRYPLQIMQLRWAIGRKTMIIGRHHADKPPRGIRRILQKIADRCINGYLFTSVGNASDWINAGIIANDKKIYESLAASTDFSGMDKEESRNKTGMASARNFLWVGRLNENKDPMTVLSGFEKYLSDDPGAILYMIFQEQDLLSAVTKKIQESELLAQSVHLVGQVSHEMLEQWYSAADFYISGSYSEGGSYALLEAMACGCIPIVTAIPAALKMTEEGKYGIIFQPGNADDLAIKLSGLSLIDLVGFSASVKKYFRTDLSTDAIAARLYGCCEALLSK